MPCGTVPVNNNHTGAMTQTSCSKGSIAQHTSI